MSQDDSSRDAHAPAHDEADAPSTPATEPLEGSSQEAEVVKEATASLAEPTQAVQVDEESKDNAQEEEPKPKKAKRERRSQGSSVPDVSFELNRLFELSTKYPELGAPLAKLAMKLGYQQLGERLLTMQLNQEIEDRGVEFYRVSANLARKEGRSKDVLDYVMGGIESVLNRGEETTMDERARLLHLVRLGFAVLLFDVQALRGAPEFTTPLVEKLPSLSELYVEDPFYKTLCAQALWFDSKESSEQAWEEAVALRDAETSWNSRGTWYKEADKDYARAEWAYRSGLRALPTSILLKHNLAQVLMDRVQHEGAELTQIRSWLDESEALLRQALRHARRHSMRRHINGNIERVKALQRDLPKEEEIIEPPPEAGQVVRGRVRSFKNYGVFLSLGKHHSGLLHISELAHERVQDPSQVLTLGDVIEVKVLSVHERDDGKGLRIALSRKAILPEPTPEEREEARRDAASRGDKGRPRPRSKRQDKRQGGQGGQRGQRSSQGQRRGGRGNPSSPRSQKSQGSSEMGSLGEMLLAKLEEKQNKDKK